MGLLKLGRNYSLLVSLPNGSQLTVAPPFTMEFDITRNTLSSANVCQIRLYNLGANTRNLLRFDWTSIRVFSFIQLLAGYGSNLSVIFTGNITQASSVRDGVNFITTIECFDGGYAFVNASLTGNQGQFPAGTPYQTVYETLISYLPHVSLGAISPNYVQDSGGAPYLTSRANSYTGNPASILAEISNGGFFIDNGKAYVLGNNYVLQNAFNQIDASSGLIGTPTREQYKINADMIFEPRVQVGQQVSLVTTTADLIGPTNTAQSINGNYKVVGVKHRGIISPVVSGDAITSVEFYTGSANLVAAAVLS